MKKINIRQLHEATGRWVRYASRQQTLLITEHGHPIAVLEPFSEAKLRRPLPDREEWIKKLPRIKVDSAELVSEQRDRA